MAAATGGFLVPTAVGGAALVFKPLSALLFMFHVKHRGALLFCLGSMLVLFFSEAVAPPSAAVLLKGYGNEAPPKPGADEKGLSRDDETGLLSCLVRACN